MKNLPYVKKYDKNGKVKNPIPTGYFHDEPNRRKRREPLQKEKHFGKRPQIIHCKDGSLKRIYHLGN